MIICTITIQITNSGMNKVIDYVINYKHNLSFVMRQNFEPQTEQININNACGLISMPFILFHVARNYFIIKFINNCTLQPLCTRCFSILMFWLRVPDAYKLANKIQQQPKSITDNEYWVQSAGCRHIMGLLMLFM